MQKVKALGLTTIALVGLSSCMPQQASVDYSDRFAETTNENRAVSATGEALDTQDVLGTLSQMLGAPDQYDVVTAMNVRFIRDLDDLNDAVYDNYTLRIADNMTIESDLKDSMPMRARVEDVLIQYPHSFIALNKEKKLIAIARDRLEAQALDQDPPRVFYVLKGHTLQDTVNRWARESGWELQWDLDRDYNMTAPAVVFGDFSVQGGALDQLLRTMRNSDQPLKAQFSRNGVVVVKTNEYSSKIMAVRP